MPGDRPPSDLLFDPPNKRRATDIRAGEVSPLTFIQAFHDMADCDGTPQGCTMPFLHSYIDSVLDLHVSVGFQNSKLYSETATKERWKKKASRSEWDPDREADDGSDGSRGGLPRRGDSS